MLRFVPFRQIRAKNRPKLEVKVLNRTKNVVPLHRDHKREGWRPVKFATEYLIP